MSIGNMSLTFFGVFSALTAIGQSLEDQGHTRQGLLLGSFFSLPAALAGAMICLYPGTELEETSIPLWADSHPLLSPLFAATGLSAGAAALTLAAAQGEGISEQSRERLNRFSIVALAAQLAGVLLVEDGWRSHGFSSLQHSSHSAMYRLSVLGCGICCAPDFSPPARIGQQEETGKSEHCRHSNPCRQLSAVRGDYGSR